MPSRATKRETPESRVIPVTKASSDRLPPSPRLSARMMIATYFTETRIVMVQNTSESTPSTVAGDRDRMMAGEGFLEGVERTRADIAEHDADGRNHQSSQLTAFRCLHPVMR